MIKAKMIVLWVVFTVIILPANALETGLWYIAPNFVLQRNNNALNEDNSTVREESLLLQSLKDGQLITVLRLLNSGTSTAIWDESGKTVISLALSGGQRNIARRIAQTLTPFNVLKQFSANPVIANIYLTYTHFNYLLKERSGSNSILLKAVQDNHFDQVAHLLQQGADVNQANIDGQSALLLAAGSNKIAMLKLLLSWGADINHCDRFGYTALAYASYTQNTAAIKLLISAGAEPMKLGSVAVNPLFISLVRSNRQLAENFYRTGFSLAALNSRGVNGETLLMYAAVYADLYHVSQLLRLRVNVNTQSNSGWTALHYALHGSKLANNSLTGQYRRIVKKLLQAGTQIDSHADILLDSDFTKLAALS